jgi:2'-5' RNA ligase
MLRLFFALRATPEQNAALAAEAAPLIAHLGAQAAPPENLHATLCFIGALEPARLDSLRAVAASVYGRHVALYFDALEHWDGPKILCATASEESASACELAMALGEATRAAGFAPDLKPFRAHLTLARKVRAEPAMHVPFPAPLISSLRMRCDRFVLMESRRNETGSVYSVLDSWPLYDRETQSFA